ncbi:intraflagellar transport 46-like protein [Chlorella sorokiniana]|uniref:Intraflagellar transport 46-like protein n=1 Tax=Chlorella sorokiniana TaxID=3076 RepID=A0A2P6TEN3_CHLSO|nr:intraflagellar transport 46-like protein [Chlorella sorokiniana]|eukprot:PRW21092.1 intraflagellar transport 46-like protein [Chlorella sorokiniana]
MDLDQLFAYADAHQPPQYALPVRLQPFLPDLVPALGAPCTFTAPPRPDGEPDFLGLTVLDEPALVQSDPATLALRLRRQAGAAGSGSGASDAAPPLGWVADPARDAQRLDAWVEQVEALHQEDASAAALAPALPDLETLMQAWSPEMQAHIESSPLPDPRQDVDLPTFARMCCAVLDLQPPAMPAAGSRAGASAASQQHCALLQSLHALFALYLEFRHNPAFQHLAAFEAAAADQPSSATAAAGVPEGA